jgi:hypothetical protein
VKLAPGRAHRLFSLLALLALLAGCATVAPERETGPAADAEARQLAAAGRYREAADVWRRLAAQARSKDTAQAYRLSAADSLLSAGDPATARQVQSEVQTRGVPAPLRLKADIITARLALAERRPEQALAALAGPYPEQTPRADRWQGQLVRADAQAQLGRPLDAARERSVAERYGIGDSDLARNRLAIWDLLGRASTRSLGENRPPPPDAFGGWMELAALQRRLGRDPAALARALDGWRARYPGHPAELDLVPEILVTARARGGMPAHIALLLPDSGPFAAPGKAVREGFVAAWFGAGGATRVSVYEATPETLQTVLDRAVDGGADFVVGPLDKGSVNRLIAESADLAVPVLALNRAEGPAGAARGEVYQFALTPEDEAREVARRARADGGSRPAMLYPESDFGERVAGAFREAWAALGGAPPAEARYGAQPDSIAAAVRTALRPGSPPPGATAATGLAPLRAAGAAGSDVDFVFLAGSPAQARQVRPQVSFQGGAGLPIYATSHVYAGVPDPRQDQDLEGVVFADMPWVLYPGTVDPALQRSFEQNWRELRDGYNRLIAFGVDAYRLVRELGRLRAGPGAAYDGVTGRLTLDAGNRLVRELAWAQFRGGVPVPLTGATVTP